MACKAVCKHLKTLVREGNWHNTEGQRLSSTFQSNQLSMMHFPLVFRQEAFYKPEHAAYHHHSETHGSAATH